MSAGEFVGYNGLVLSEVKLPGAPFKRWLMNRGDQEVVTFDIFEELNGRWGNVSWPVRINEERVDELSGRVQGLFKGAPPEVVYDGHTLSFDSPDYYVGINVTKPGDNPKNESGDLGANVEFRQDIGPDDPLIQSVFTLTSQDQIGAGDIESIASAIATTAFTLIQ